MDGARVAERAHVLDHRFAREVLDPRGAAPEAAQDVPGRVALEHALGQRRFLDEEEPVPVGARELLRRVLVHLERRRDVEHGERAHALAKVARQAMADAPAAVVADDVEAEEAERLHHFGHVERHRALGVVGVPRHAARLGRIAVAAQVGADHCVVACERRGDLVPHRVRLRIAVKQQHGCAFTTPCNMDRGAAGADVAGLEAGKKIHSNSSAAATLRSSATRML